MRTLSDAERSRLQQLRAQIDAERDEILAQARQRKAAHEAEVARLRGVNGPSTLPSEEEQQ